MQFLQRMIQVFMDTAQFMFLMFDHLVKYKGFVAPENLAGRRSNQSRSLCRLSLTPVLTLCQLRLRPLAPRQLLIIWLRRCVLHQSFVSLISTLCLTQMGGNVIKVILISSQMILYYTVYGLNLLFDSRCRYDILLPIPEINPLLMTRPCHLNLRKHFNLQFVTSGHLALSL